MKGDYDGLYIYFVKNFSYDRLDRQTARCVIIKETDKSYRIRLTEFANGRFPGEELWVRKKSVVRSYLNNQTKICDIYNLVPALQSCRACFRKCQRRYDLNNVTL